MKINIFYQLLTPNLWSLKFSDTLHPLSPRQSQTTKETEKRKHSRNRKTDRQAMSHLK